MISPDDIDTLFVTDDPAAAVRTVMDAAPRRRARARGTREGGRRVASSGRRGSA